MNRLDKLPDTARVWIFTFRETLTPAQNETISHFMKAFTAQWMSHGAGVAGSFEVRENRFLIVAADTSRAEVSGCSIDGMYRSAEEIAARAGASLAENSLICFRAGETVQLMDRPSFRKTVQAGNISPETVMYDNSVTLLADLRQGKWEVPFAQSWHAAHFAPRAKAQG